MKENSFKRNRKAMMALLLCTGFIVTQPISVMAEEIMIFAQTTQQQKQSVSGVIKDATGEPVIGASVLEKGTTNGTITDFDGRFTLNVIPVYLANLHTSFLCNLIYPTFSRILLYSC